MAVSTTREREKRICQFPFHERRSFTRSSWRKMGDGEGDARSVIPIPARRMGEMPTFGAMAFPVYAATGELSCMSGPGEKGQNEFRVKRKRKCCVGWHRREERGGSGGRKGDDDDASF
jgi:hypothetical protein